LSPDFIFARSEKPLDTEIMEKLALFSGLPVDKIIDIPDLDSVYRVPLLLSECKIVEMMNKVSVFSDIKETKLN
jgi:CTP synthase